MDCEGLNLRCQMGSLPEWAWSFLAKKGVTTSSCVSYSSGVDPRFTLCEDHSKQCEDGTDMRWYKAKSFRHVAPVKEPQAHLADIMAEVMQGPVDVTFNVYGDFYENWQYAGTTGVPLVYVKRKGGNYMGLHSVRFLPFVL